MTTKGKVIDMDAMIDQLERPDLDGSRLCFDRQEYEIVVVSNDVMQAVKESDVEQIASLPEWKKDLVETAENILFYEKERYLDIPKVLVFMIKHLMAEFINSLPDNALKKELHAVLEDGSPVEAFEKALFEYPEEKERWADLCDKGMREAIRDWLKEKKIIKAGEGR
ncbi:MAG: hypothetical protein IMF07_05510 [Proteobacteria bacterium]|nr:hypothetical protein [Pseudomonadota bacterium]